MTTDTIVNLDGVHNTLVDINGTIKFFDSLVRVTPSTSDLSKKYKVGIVSQEELDNGDIKTKEVSNVYSTTITKNSGEFQNLFLYLQSSEPMNAIEVQITTTELPTALETQETFTPEDATSSTTSLYLKISMAVLILLFGCFMLRKFYKERS